MSISAPEGTSSHHMLAVRPSKWTLVVVVQLGEGPRRFGELRRDLGGVSQKTLTAVLRELERDGFVSREAFATIPPRVDYDLTELGRELLELAHGWRHFAMRNRQRVEQARQMFDAAERL
ncbi:MAG: helix-turn-helix transcriptional regulator [Devosia sp.]|uniref:winged helix-turn-helix transcriptional regulator n=1 Tax=Devosia sp. TaxID=1871048 RepID=UPI0024C6B6C5|nr:helix-turn-helix domain-containing protein [Devosia sp.]UYN98900.1 MAG: helix-turn-helix transcriptional regulator [Devosia sp.]